MQNNLSSLRRVGFWSTACLLLALTGCANVNSVYRPIYAAEGQGALIDVKQRAILVGKREVNGAGEVYTGNAPRQFVICAEPSPDAMSAYAGEFAGRLALSPVGGATGKSESLAIQGAMREAAVYVGLRTPSVQLLRDAMYRVCEAYSNGGIDSAQYELLMRRYQRHIVALAAIEQLTQATRVPPVMLTSEGSVGGDRHLAEWMEEITRQQGLQAKQQSTADTEAAKVKDAANAVTEAQQALKKDPNDAAAQKKLKDGEVAQRKAEAAKKTADEEVKRAKARIQSLESHMVGGSSLGGRTAADVAEAAGGVSPEHLQAVAGVVQTIALNVLDTDDTQAMCFAVLSASEKQHDALIRMCSAQMDVMKEAAALAMEKLRACKTDTRCESVDLPHLGSKRYWGSYVTRSTRPALTRHD